MSLNRANTYSGTTTFAGHTGGAVNLTLGNQLALQNSTLTMNGIGSLIFSSNVLANAFTFGGLAATSAGARYNITLQNNAATAIALSVGKNNANTTYAGVMGGSGSLVKIGTGTLTLSGKSTYSGTTTISNGILKFVVGGSCANSTVILDVATATNSVSITDNTQGWTNSAFTANAAGTLEFNFGPTTPSTSVSPLEITGNADFTVTPPVRVVVDSGLSPGEYPLMTWGTTSGTAPTNSDLTVTTVAGGTVAGLSNSPTTLYLVITGTTPTFVKTNNVDDLNLGSSWVGGVAPSAAEIARWDSTVLSANTTVLGADTTWAGIAVTDPAGLVTINAGHTLTLGAAAVDINMTAATNDLTLNCGLALGAPNVWGVAADRLLTVGGAVSGANTLTLQNGGTVILSSGANSYSGNTTVAATTTLQLGAAEVIPHGSGKGDITVNGTLDLNTFSETLNGLNGSGTVDTVAGSTPTLTVGANSPFVNNPFSGVIQNTSGTLSLTKTGTNLLALTGANNTFSGAVQINEGFLAVGSASAVTDVLPNVSGITISNGATLGAWTNTTLTVPVTVASGATVSIAAPLSTAAGSGTTAKTFSLQGGISGNGNVVFKGVNLANSYGHILVANGTYTGSTLMTCSDELIPSLFSSIQTNNNEIIVRLAGDNALPPTTVLTMDGNIGVGSSPGRFCDLNLNGKNQTLAGLTNVPRNLRVQRILNPAGLTAATLTINNSVDYEFSGQLGGSGGSLGGTTTGNNFSLVKSGSGTFYLSRAAGNTYTNDTTVTGGTLRIRTSSFATNSTVSVAAGAVLQLDSLLTNVVTAFLTNGVSLPPGIYSSNNVAPFIAGSGSLQIPGAGPSGPASITSSVSGNTLTLTWPAGETWRLVGQTNSLSTGVDPSPSAWFTVPGGVDGSNSITIDPGNPAVFYQLVSP